jgi:hypothetical protein
MMKRLLAIVALLSLCLFAQPPTVHAFDFFNHVSCGGSNQSQSAVCSSKTSNDPIGGTNGALAHITRIIAYLAGAAAVIILILSGIRYATSGGDATKVASAKGTAFNAIIGLLIIVVAQALIVFVIRRL